MKRIALLRYCVIALFVLTLAGCRTVKVIEQVPVEVHDTAYVNREVHDSTYIDKWHTIYQKGDTVYDTKEITITKTITKTDTAYKVVERPITVTRTETVEVKKPLGWWQKLFMWMGVMGAVGIIGYVGWKVYRRFR